MRNTFTSKEVITLMNNQNKSYREEEINFLENILDSPNYEDMEISIKVRIDKLKEELKDEILSH